MEFKITVETKKKLGKSPFVFNGEEVPKEKKIDPQESQKMEMKKLILENRETFKDLLKE
jgi:hypothetical protein